MSPLPVATVRTSVTVPLQLADGYAATARVTTFDGLADGSHLTPRAVHPNET